MVVYDALLGLTALKVLETIGRWLYQRVRRSKPRYQTEGPVILILRSPDELKSRMIDREAA